MTQVTQLGPMPGDRTRPGLAVRLPLSQVRLAHEMLRRSWPAGQLVLVCDPAMPVDFS